MIEDFTQYDIKPSGFINYLRYYGLHFNKKLCDFACSHMPTIKYNKEQVESILTSYGVTLPNAKLHDAVFLSNWCYNTLFGNTITTENLMVAFLQDMFTKEGDLIFNRWYADVSHKGIPIEWEEMI